MLTTTNHLKNLIAFKTISGLDHQTQVSSLYAYVTQHLDSTFYQSELYSQNGFQSLIVTPQNNQHPAVFLYCHIDVVPGPNHLFKAVIQGGKLIGRGASDMKFALACYLSILQRPQNVGLILTSDEEIGGFNGFKAFVNHLAFSQASLVIMPDGGNNFSLVTAAKGVLHLKITATGTSAHGSRPWEGDNAFHKLLLGYQKLSSHFNDFSQGNWTNTVNLAKFSGGDAINKIPDSASMFLDLRFTEHFTVSTILKQVQTALPPDVTIDILVEGNSIHIPQDNPYIQTWQQLITATYPQIPLNLDRDHGTSDARFLPSHIIALMTKPNSGGHHSDNEWIDLHSLHQFQVILDKYVSLIARQ